MQSFLELVKKLGAGRLAAMAAVTVALIGFFGFVITRFSEPTMATLFTGLDVKDSAAVVKELESAGVAYQLRGDGSTILVPQDRVARMRMSLAQSGLPAGGSVGYEIFDKGDSLSSTSFIQNINQLRALEGELARTIRSLDRVESARVHLVIPERALFQRDREPPSASIVLKVRGGLEQGQIRAIRHLVASAVEGLKPERVSVVDEAGALLADGAGSEAQDIGFDDRRAAFEKRMSEQVRRIVESVVGAGRTRVQVSAELDVNRITQTQDLYDPDSKVVRSTQTREESAESATNRNQGVTVGNELPGATGQTATPGQDQSRKVEETINYEISHTTKTETIDGGRIRRLSVAVLVDGVYVRDASGNVTYTPRAKEELDRIGALVRSAIGYDQQRGDQIEVVNLRFAEGPPPPEEQAADAGWLGYFSFTKNDIMRMAELGVLAILSLFVLLLVVRPLVRRVVSPEMPSAARSEVAGLLPGPEAEAAEEETAKLTLPRPEDNKTLKMLDVAQLNGDIQQKSVDRIGELVERNPSETLSLVRTWLSEPAT